MFRSNCRLSPVPSALLSALVATVSVVLGTVAPRPAYAQNGATSYSTTQRVFKVGILLFDSTTDHSNATEEAKGPENPDPYVFFVADQRIDLKPQGWAFINPLAPATVTSAAKTRWDARVGGNSGYQVGQKVTPNMATYWEVSLTDTPISQLTQFDMLFITNHRRTAFNDADREKLRKLVDAGGVLWIEDCGGMVIGGGDTATSTGSFFLDQVQFEGNGFGNFQTSGPAVYQPAHPLLNAPYALTLSELSNLGDKNYGNYHIATYAGLASQTGQSGQAHTVETLPNADTLVNIVGNTGGVKDPGTQQYLPYIAAGHYGSGSVLLTSGDSGCDINDYCGGTGTASGGNSGAFAGLNLQTAHSEDLKFLYNSVNWGSSNSAPRRNDRRTGASFESINAPLLPQFNFASLYRTNGANSPGGDRVKSKSAPLIANGLMFVAGLDGGGDFTSGGNVTVRCYDTQPFRDYDSDGNYDDGGADVSIGLPYDEIWRYAGKAATAVNGIYEQPSSPVLATVPGAATVLGATVPADEIFVSGPDGTLYVFSATLNLGNGSIPSAPAAFTVAPPNGAGSYDPVATHGVAPAPVVYGNLVYQVEPNGQVRAINILTRTVEWVSFTGAAPDQIVPTATPTVGFSLATVRNTFAQNSNFNTNDLMLYVPAEVTKTGEMQPSGQILAYWLGTRNEVQTFLASDGQGSGGTAIIDTRVGGGGGSVLAGALYTANQPYSATSPFIRPTVRVYSNSIEADGSTRTAQQNYVTGTISKDYTGAFIDDPNGGLPTGKVQITKIGGSAALDPGLLPGKNGNILASVDYDVLYITPNVTPNKPAGYDAFPIGARLDQTLTIRNYLPKTTQTTTPPGITSPIFPGTPGGGLDTMTLSPEDILVFSADQQVPSSGAATTPWLTSLFGMHEQAGASQLLWRFGLHDSGAADGTTDGVSIVDGAPIFNYNLMTIFDGTYAMQPPFRRNALPEYISGLKVVGTPVTTNSGLTYVIASGLSTPATGNGAGLNPYGLNQGPVTVLMAFQTNPTITLTLPISFDPNGAVLVSQVNALDNSSTNTAGSAQLSIDAQHGKITLTNFTASGGVSGAQFSASQSFVVAVTPVGQRDQVRFVVHPLPPSANSATYLSGNGVDTTGTINADSGGYTPLQYYYVLPGTPTSSPTLIGDYIFFNMTPLVTPPGGGTASYGVNCVAAVDANPGANDPSVRLGFGEPILNIDKHLRWLTPIVDLSGTTGGVVAYGAPVGSQGTLAVNSTIGSFAYQDQITLIADGKRVIEVGPDGAASWTLDSTSLISTLGGDLPIFDPTGGIINKDANGDPPTGRTTILSKTLSHPNTSRKIGNGDYLIADSGNNRVIRVDRGGKQTWTLDKIADPYKLLAGSDPTSLSGPTDVQYYVAPSPVVGGNPAGYEVHYLVADPGNFRIVEVADYFDSHGIAADSPYAHTGNVSGLHSLVWITRTQSTQGQRLAYTNIQRFLGVDPTNTYSGYPYVIATVGNSSVGGSSSSGGADFTGGALVSLNYAPYSTGLPVNALSNGASTVKTLWVNGNPEPIANGTILASANDLRETVGGQTFGVAGSVTPTASNPTGFNIRKLTHPAYFTEVNLPNLTSSPPTIRNIYLICDSSAVYAVEATVDTAGNAVRNVLWKFTQSDYDVMNITSIGRLGLTTAVSNGKITTAQLPRFVPSSVQLLPNGDFLITNSFYGRSPLFQSGQFNGESFQVTPTLNPGSVVSNGGTGATINAPSGGFSLYTAASSTTTGQGGFFSGFSAPRVTNASAVSPLFIQQMGATGNTNLLEQPLFSNRP